MRRTRFFFAIAVSLASISSVSSMVGMQSASADAYNITATGEVDFSLFNSGAFANVNSGDEAILSFLIDSNDFLDSTNFPTRGYVIDQSSFSLTIGGHSMFLESPFPTGQTPYFVLRDNDPAVDGFFISVGPEIATGLPLNETGNFGALDLQFLVTYGNDPLPSLDIADAAGTYDFTGLTVFGFRIEDGPGVPMEISFIDLNISRAVPEPGSSAILLGASVFGLVRRRRD